MNKIFVLFLSLFYIGQLWADDCLVYKNMPRVFIEEPDYTTHIVQPNKNMDLWHGNVVATLVDNYDIITDVKPVNDGYCVVLKTVKSIFGYNDFLVNIAKHLYISNFQHHYTYTTNHSDSNNSLHYTYNILFVAIY